MFYDIDAPMVWLAVPLVALAAGGDPLAPRDRANAPSVSGTALRASTFRDTAGRAIWH